ncbi:hypothetical protein N431DRAFT_288456, partial [Stipitochalara longipes BDJ]
SRLSALWALLGLDFVTVLMMLKGALPPTLGMAIYQATSVADTFQTIGYLVPIIASLCLCMLPRAKFVEMMLLNAASTALAYALSLLAAYCGLQARWHSLSAAENAAELPYNSSAAVVCAIWLIFYVWLSTAIRARRKHLFFPSVMFCIYINIAMPYTSFMPSWGLITTLLHRITIAFLTGYSLAILVGLLIVPVSCRRVAFKEITGYLQLTRKVLKQQASHIHKLKTLGALDDHILVSGSNSLLTSLSTETSAQDVWSISDIRETLAQLDILHSKIGEDISYAKREVAFGCITANDFEKLSERIQELSIVLTGVDNIGTMLRRLVRSESNKADFSVGGAGERKQEKEEEKEIEDAMRILDITFLEFADIIDSAINHSLLLLELNEPRKQEQMNIRKHGESTPGDSQYFSALEKRVVAFQKLRITSLESWKTTTALEQTQMTFNFAAQFPGLRSNDDKIPPTRAQQELLLLLWIENLFNTGTTSILKLSKFAEDKRRSGKMDTKRFIYPSLQVLKEWLFDAFSTDRNDQNVAGETSTVRFEDSDFQHRDPEHLPPQNWYEKTGTVLRHCYFFIGSEDSSLGLWAACATMTIAILAFLKNTHIFFINQRVVWASVSIAVSMSPTSGFSVFGLFGRVMGSVLAMVFTLINYYIVDGHTGGIIALSWLFMSLDTWIIIKIPRQAVIGVLGLVTHVIILGYITQYRKLGVELASVSGQEFYPVYILGPQRLLCVTAGCCSAFFWTLFPGVARDRSELRKGLGTSLYILANYYSCIKATFQLKLKDSDSSLAQPLLKSNERLTQIRRHLYIKQITIAEQLKEHNSFQSWEPNLGGKFPSRTYNSITSTIQKLSGHLALLSLTVQNLRSSIDSPSENSVWHDDVVSLCKMLDMTDYSFANILCILSAALDSGHSLPPNTTAPPSYQLDHALTQLDGDIFNLEHIVNPEYCAFAASQMLSAVIREDLVMLVSDVRLIVGEIDFSAAV